MVQLGGLDFSLTSPDDFLLRFDPALPAGARGVEFKLCLQQFVIRVFRKAEENSLKPPIRQRYFSTDDQRTTDASKAGAQTFFARTEKGPMRRCAQCHGRLGLGVRFRNLWSGHGWVHLRFCSTRCEGIFKQDREEANAKRRWYTVLSPSGSRS